MGQSAVPQFVLQNRAKLDKTLYSEADDEFEIDIEPGVETEDINELVEEFGEEAVQLSYYYFHRHRLYKMKLLPRFDLDSTDVVAFLLIEEEQALRQAQQSLKMQQQSERTS